MQAMPKGHPLPFRLLSACFGKRGASSTVARSLSPRSAKGGTAASPLYGSFSAFLGLGSDTRGLRNYLASGAWTALTPRVGVSRRPGYYTRLLVRSGSLTGRQPYESAFTASSRSVEQRLTVCDSLSLLNTVPVASVSATTVPSTGVACLSRNVVSALLARAHAALAPADICNHQSSLP